LDDFYAELNFRLLAMILQNQLELLNRTYYPPMRVASPPYAIYVPIKKKK